MQQRVHHISYLAVSSVELNALSQTAKDYILIPKGANIIDVKLEVEDSEGKGEVEVALSGAGVKFFENTALDSSEIEKRFLSSSIHTSTKENDTLSIKLTSGSFSSGKVIIKVLYFLPSQIMTEF